MRIIIIIEEYDQIKESVGIIDNYSLILGLDTTPTGAADIIIITRNTHSHHASRQMYTMNNHVYRNTFQI